MSKLKSGSTIEIRRWDVLDIYYYDKDFEKVEKLVEEYKTKGWDDDEWDSAGNKSYDGCVQLQRHHKNNYETY